jgi:hypothetical protein
MSSSRRPAKIAVAICALVWLTAESGASAQGLAWGWLGNAPGGPTITVGEQTSGSPGSSTPNQPSGGSPFCWIPTEAVAACGGNPESSGTGGNAVPGGGVVQGPPPPTPAQLGQTAINELPLAAPDLQLSPDMSSNPTDPGGLGANHWQYVNLPTWAWVSAWNASHASASGGGVTATATAQPLALNITYQDGPTTHSLTCNGPGTEYSDALAQHEDPTNPVQAASPTCGWIYLHSSAAAPDETETVTASITYDASWSAGAAGGADFGEVRGPTQTLQVMVGEVQAIITNGGPATGS